MDFLEITKSEYQSAIKMYQATFKYSNGTESQKSWYYKACALENLLKKFGCTDAEIAKLGK